MKGSLALILFLLLLQVLCTHLISSSPTTTVFSERNKEYVKKSCNATIYKRLCYDSLSIYATEIDANPKLLAYTALNVTLTKAKSTSMLMGRMSKIHGLKPRVAAATADCVEEVADSVYEIEKSIREINHIRKSNFDLTISDVQTWVSAALTDDDTCMDGFAGIAMNGNVKTLVRIHIVKVAHMTSNALALINNYASTQNNSVWIM